MTAPVAPDPRRWVVDPCFDRRHFRRPILSRAFAAGSTVNKTLTLELPGTASTVRYSTPPARNFPSAALTACSAGPVICMLKVANRFAPRCRPQSGSTAAGRYAKHGFDGATPPALSRLLIPNAE